MNTSCENENYDVPISDLLLQVLKKWRVIFWIGLIIAVLIVIFRFTPLYNSVSIKFMNNTVVTEKELLQESINELQSEVEYKEKELAESIYYNLEPSMISKGYISYYVDAPINNDLGYQRNLVSLYTNYFNSGELYINIARKMSEPIEPVYISQIVKVEITEPSSFSIYVLGSNSKQTKEIMQSIQQELSNKKTEYSNLVKEHTIRLIAENIVVISDSDVMDDQDFQNQRLVTLKAELNDMKSQYLRIEPAANTTTDVLAIVLKLGLIGFLSGIALTITYYSVTSILFSKIISRKQIIKACKVDVLGEFIKEKEKKNKIDVVISKLAHEPYDMTNDDINFVIANKIIAKSKSKKILFVGGRDVMDNKTIFNGISACEILKDYEMIFSSKTLDHIDILDNISDVGSIIIILNKNNTTLDELQNAICTINSYHKDLVGVIVA